MTQFKKATGHSSKFFCRAWRAGLRGVLALELLLPFIAQRAYAQTFNINSPPDIATQILCPIAAVMFFVLIGVSSIMVLYAAFLYLTARGETETVSKAHKTVTYAAIAIAVALLAKAFPVVVASTFGQSVTGCP